MTSMPAAVLWDMDGTLVDTEPFWIATERALVESHGNEWPDHHAHAIVGFDLLDSGAYIAEHGRVPMTPRSIVDHLLDGVVAKIREAMPWRPGALELLRALNGAEIPCALVTMSWQRFVDPVLAALPSGTFGAIITGDSVANGKPHPEPYLNGAAALHVDAVRCVAIEDSPTGVRSAVDAGCHVIAVPNVKTIDAGPNVTVMDSLAEIDLDWLARWWTARA